MQDNPRNALGQSARQTWPEEVRQLKTWVAINIVSLSTAPNTRTPAGTCGLTDTRAGARARGADAANGTATAAVTSDTVDTTGRAATVETAHGTASARTNPIDATNATATVETADVGIITGPLSK
jgi:hypothetical protein